MRILVTGATGFIGRHLVAHLAGAGHHVICGVRDPARSARLFPGLEHLACDFNCDIAPSAWEPRLQGVDAVINCAGILQGRPGQSITAIHTLAPKALFDACLATGVRRVIQISALGAEPEAGTAYAETKHAADLHLQSLDLAWTVVQPSLAYTTSGSYGGTSLFRALAALPFMVPVVGDGRQAFQPIHMADLAVAICRLLEAPEPPRRVVKAVGPEAVAFRELLLALRSWLGLPPARVVRVPKLLAAVAARFGDLFGHGPVNTTALKMMTYGNTAEPDELVEITGIEPRSFYGTLAREPAHVQDRWHARLYFLRPFLRLTLALFWIATGLVTLFWASRDQVFALLELAGVPSALLPFALWGGAVTDIVLGGLLLFAWRVRLVALLQLAVTAVYLLALSFGLPDLWLDPLGPLVKTLPIMVATLVMIAIEDDR